MSLKRIFLPVICMLCGLSCIAQDIHFTLLDPPKVEPWDKVVSFTQDKRGYLWLATSYGLQKYDGHQYVAYRRNPANSNSLSSNTLETVYTDGDGIIWVGTFGTGFDRFDPVRNTFTHYSRNNSRLVSDSVTAFAEDKEGYLWVGTMRGLERFDKAKTFTHYLHQDSDPSSLSNNQVRALLVDRDGVLWVGTGSPFVNETPRGEGGLNKFDKKTGKFIRYVHSDRDEHSLINNMVRSIFEDSKRKLWVGTVGPGLQILDRKTGKFERLSFDPKHPDKLSAPQTIKTDMVPDALDHVTFINEDWLGRIWIGTLDGGINVYNRRTGKTTLYSEKLTGKQHLETSQYWCSYRTQDSILWIASWGEPEVYKISPYDNKLPHYRLNETVNCFLEDAAGKLWLGTNKGLRLAVDSGNKQVFSVSKDPKSDKNIVDYMVKDNENKIWIKNKTGLYVFDPVNKKFKEYHHKKGDTSSLVSDEVLFIKPARPGTLWVGTRQGLDLMDIKKEKFKHYQNKPADPNSISFNSIYSIEIDNKQNVWVGTERGLNKLKPGTIKFKRYLDGYIINCTLKDSRGNVWVATNDGLFRYNAKEDTFSNYKTPATEIFWICEDKQHDFWLNASVGLVKLSFKGDSSESNIYGKNEGFDVRTVRTYGAVRRKGEILYGDTAGYFILRPKELMSRTPRPKVVINEFLLADIPVPVTKNGILTKPIADTRNIQLKYYQRTFSFKISSIDFVSGETLEANTCMLEPQESQFRPVGPDGKVTYTNIAPGNYIFKVRSQNSDGVFAEMDLEVIVNPPWWKRWWAYAGFAALFMAGIWLFIHLRSLALIREKRILEYEVELRTNEVKEQKEEITAQRDSLEQALEDLKITQRRLIQSEKMASLGEFTSGIAQEIQTPLNLVNSFSQKNIELINRLMGEQLKKPAGDQDGNTAEMLAMINDNIGDTLYQGKHVEDIVKGIIQHSQANKAPRELTDINLLADEYSKLANTNLQAKDSSANIKLSVYLDDSIPKLYVIRQEIGKVLLDLIGNAFYSVRQKQKKAGSDYVPEVSINTGADKRFVFIKVKDNGIGIPAGIQDKIMQPFFTTRPAGEATGLGLFLSYDTIVNGHNGNLTFGTIENKFAEFVVRLPIRGIGE